MAERAEGHGLEGLQGIEIVEEQAVAEVGVVAGTRLPEEGGDVVIDGTLVAALVVDIEGLVVEDHHVAGLEVAIEEAPSLARGGAVEERIAQAPEVVLEPELIHRIARRLEETILEVVEVPVDGSGTETGFAEGIVLEVEAPDRLELDSRQVAHHLME